MYNSKGQKLNPRGIAKNAARAGMSTSAYSSSKGYSSNTSSPTVPQVAKPKTTLAQSYANSVAPKTNYQSSFGQVLPYESFVNRPMVQNFAYSRVDPEVERMRYNENRGLDANLSSSGLFRTGLSSVYKQDLTNDISRRREEMAQPFMQTGMDYLSNYYNDLEGEYYNDPNTFQYNPIDMQKLLLNLGY